MIETSTSSVGGKASSLLKLKEAGFPVPSFAIVPTGIFKQARENKFATIPSTFETELSTIIKTFSTPVAVRSSASKEDGSSQSFAGLFETYLDVQGEAEKQHFEMLAIDLHRTHTKIL